MSKRRKLDHIHDDERGSCSMSTSTPFSNDEYTVGWICAVPVEMAAAKAMLDETHPHLPNHPNDYNTYTLGRIGVHNVVVACMGSGVYGTTSAAVLATQMRSSFRSIRFGLMVGIGGGAPTKSSDIRLGDVVVSKPIECDGGVVQYDYGKTIRDGEFKRTGMLNKPPQALLTALSDLQADHKLGLSHIPKYLSEMAAKYPTMVTDFTHPGREQDQLFEAQYEHVELEDTCKRCDPSRLVVRPPRAESDPIIHYGLIASGNQVLKHGGTRDRLAQKLGILCFEMEAAGLMDHFPCLVIRGICDYADSHKNKQWQPYAAAVAAAYAKELLLVVPALEPSSNHVPGASSPGWTGNIALNPRHGTIPVDEQGKYQRLLQSLTFERMDARLLNITNALPETCQWVFKEEKFKVWIERINIEDHYGFLWIKGKPGSGKSTIMKEALKKVKRKRSGDIIISYFFNARSPSHLEKSGVGMYRSLVHQILQACPRFRELFTDMFDTKDRGGFIDDWTPAELQEFLTDIVENLGDCPLNVFIDALDEGDENDVRRLIAFLEELSLRAVTCGTSLRICLSSRHYPQISLRKGLSLVMEHQDGHRDDIDMYVQRKLVGDEGHKMEELRDKVCQKSSRVFLWVVLVIPILNQLYDRGHVAAMEKRLEEIPEDLGGLFAEILAKHAEDINSSVLLLQLVLFSMRPLSPVELYLAIQSGSTFSSGEDTTTLPEETVGRYLLNCSRGLTEVTRTKPPLVQFIHETVRDFLIRENGLAMIDPALTENIEAISHERLHTACLLYFDQCLPLDQEVQDRWVPECKLQAAEVQCKFPFSDYAVSYLFSHADVAEARGIRHRDFLRRFRTNSSEDLLKWVQYRNTFQRHNVRKYTVKVHLLYILAEQNLVNLGKVLIDDKVDVNARGQRYGNALKAACAGGHEQMTQLLLQSGASINAKDGEHGYALCAAIHGKHDSIIRLLLRTRMLPPAKALEKWLFFTIARGYLYGVETLIEAGARTSCRNDRGETTLYLAVEKNRLEVFKLLIQEGANVNAHCGRYGNALQAASARGYEQLARLLINKNADVNAQGGLHGNALQAALVGGYEQIARLLIEEGADVNAQGGIYGNALQAALVGGCEQMVRLLIEKEADINAQGGHYGNALQAASIYGYEQIARLLINKNADVNTQGGFHGNALQAALVGRHEQIVRLLIEKGADINAQGGYYGNALQAASVRGQKEIVRLLIEKGADVNAQGGFYGNALQAASVRGDELMIRLLIEKGADVNA